MKVKIRIDRAAAIEAGRDCYGDTVVTVNPADLTQSERKVLAEAPECDGITDITHLPDGRYPSMLPDAPGLADADDALSAVRSWLSWRLACAMDLALVENTRREKKAVALAQATQDAEAYIAYWRAQPANRFIIYNHDLRSRSHERRIAALPESTDSPSLPSSYYYPDIHASIRAALDDKIAEAEKIIAQMKVEDEKRRADAERAEAAKVERRKAQIANWVGAHGNANMQGRFALGLLSQTEVVDDIRNHSYASLEDFPRYKKIRWHDLEHDDDCYSSENALDCETTEDGVMLSDKEYYLYLKIERAAPAGSSLTVVSHSCHCDSCDAGMIRKSLRVAVSVGELDFTREYALSVD